MQEKLRQIGDKSEVKEFRSVAGGDINNAYYVKTEKNKYFIKTNEKVPSDFFQLEAKGLEAIRQTNTINVPKVYHYDIATNNEEIMLIMEWIAGDKRQANGNLLGENLASMHLAEAGPQYGLDIPTFVGDLVQENSWYDSWVEYYQKQRLQTQLELGIQRDSMPQMRRSRLETLIDKLDNYIPKRPKVSLLHGDLWGGNWLAGPRGIPYLIDPSILYGDHAFEIAFTELFGGFPTSFYQSYQAIFPLPDYYEDIKPIYQLFYLLVHLNIFGEGYGGAVDRILNQYT
ncbi:fructosamine kinase family protein [Gracilibacillus dipsosauri]|uniref:Fructosamine kinase n=1 Tax=Gracilibacillus dipsosauri TaxID=178340 RepID=A0A317KV51_9BACI|nr:fructosamine kinase family protein [Gracilibacillus dipsosauri]PWU67034.1 fructosamine kinase [Gracilibacillus dipsosauri]